MAFHNKPLLVVMAVLVVVLATSTTLTEAQEVQSCASKLVSCYKFINSTNTPDSSCCNGIKDAVNNELSCLCTLYNTPGLLANFNVTVDQALRLTRSCNVPADVSACNSTASSPTSNPPPGTPGSDDNSAGRVAWTGIATLLLLWASMLLY